jgi:WD40 repeat protein
MLEGPLPSSEVGFVDLATGKVTRWVQLDHPVASLAWSPDGSTVLATAYDGDPDLQKPEGNDSFRLGDAKRTGFVLVDPVAGTASFTALPNREMNVGRADVGWTADGKGVWSPSGTPDELFFDLEGRPASGNRDDLNSNIGIDAASLSLTSPDGRYTITQASGLPTAITDNQTGDVFRQQALQVLAWADDEHVVTLAGCSKPCEGTSEFRNGLVLMKYDGSDAVQLTGPRKGVDDWAFELTPR